MEAGGCWEIADWKELPVSVCRLPWETLACPPKHAAGVDWRESPEPRRETCLLAIKWPQPVSAALPRPWSSSDSPHCTSLTGSSLTLPLYSSFSLNRLTDWWDYIHQVESIHPRCNRLLWLGLQRGPDPIPGRTGYRAGVPRVAG